MMRNYFRAIFAFATLLIAPAVLAATFTVELTMVKSEVYAPLGSPSTSFISGQTFGQYNDATGVVTLNPGTTILLWRQNPDPSSVQVTVEHTNWSIGAGTYSASEFDCIDGPWAASVDLCGNYAWGSNGFFESSVAYGPGTAASRAIGGDDVELGPLRQGSEFAATTVFWNGTILMMETDDWINSFEGEVGYQLQFNAVLVPVPAALWLFSSALGLFSFIRCKNI